MSRKQCFCRKWFRPENKLQKYCTERCKALARNARGRKSRKGKQRDVICQRCGKKFNRAKGGRTPFCPPCYRQVRRECRNKNRVKKETARRLGGLCPFCGVKSVDGLVYCERHREQKNRLCRQKEDKSRSDGLCVRCRMPAEPGQVKCAYHLKKQRVRCCWKRAGAYAVSFALGEFWFVPSKPQARSASEPTEFRPGSLEKMAVLSERLLAGQPLSHKEDY